MPKNLTLRTWLLSTELRRRRVAAGLTIAEVVRRTEISRPTLQRTEAGGTTPQPRNLKALLVLYRVPQHEQAPLIELATQPETRGWWDAYRDLLPEDYATYIEFEAHAEHIRNFEGSFVPGLLQTPAYADAVIRGSVPGISDDEVTRRVRVRLQRHDVLRGERPLRLHVVVDEGVLRRVVGGPDIMRDQLRVLANELPNSVTVQVVPFGSGAHPGMSGPFSILRFPRAPERDRPAEAVFVEAGAGQLFLDREEDLQQYDDRWKMIISTGAALSPVESKRWIGDVATTFG